MKNTYFIGAVQIDNNVGEPIIEVKSTDAIDLSSGHYEQIKNYSADFTGDGEMEKVYITIPPDIIMEKDNKVLWKLYKGDVMDLFATPSDSFEVVFNDITGDGILDICCYGGDAFYAYSFVNGQAKQISHQASLYGTPIMKMGINHTVQYVIFKYSDTGHYNCELYQYKEDKFILQDIQIIKVDNIKNIEKEFKDRGFVDFKESGHNIEMKTTYEMQ